MYRVSGTLSEMNSMVNGGIDQSNDRAYERNTQVVN